MYFNAILISIQLHGVERSHEYFKITVIIVDKLTLNINMLIISKRIIISSIVTEISLLYY